MEKEFYISKEQFITLKAKWNETKHHSASDVIIYNILRSKPADNGFCCKTKNIQGNDEWYGFNQAQFTAASFCSPYRKYVGKWVEDNEPTLKRFKEKFGIDMPTDLL